MREDVLLLHKPAILLQFIWRFTNIVVLLQPLVE